MFTSETIISRFNKDGDNAIWIETASNLTRALYSVLVSLKEAGELSAPDGKRHHDLTFGLFREWFELENLKRLVNQSHLKGVEVSALEVCLRPYLDGEAGYRLFNNAKVFIDEIPWDANYGRPEPKV